MRILFASQSFFPNIGGVSTHLLNLGVGLQQRGHSVSEVHLRPPNAESYEEIRNISVFRVPKEPLDRKMLAGYSRFKEAVYNESHGLAVGFTKDPVESEGYAEYYKVNDEIGNQLDSLLEKELPEVVHIHDFQLLLLYRYIPRGIPLIFTWHIPFVPTMSRFLKEFMIRHMNEFDRVIFSTRAYADEAVKHGLIREKVEVICPITDTALFKKLDVPPSRFRKRYRMKKNAQVILCVQRIDRKSGHEQLIRAMPAVLKKYPEARLVFVGGKSLSGKISNDRKVYEKRVKDVIKELGLRKKVVFTGNIDYESLPEVYNSADIVALTSKLEGFGLSVTEGMACGKAIIGTNAGGIPEQVKHGYNGYLVGVGDYKATAAYIIKLLGDEKLRERMGQNGMKTVKKKFLKSYTVDKHIKLYHDVLLEKTERYSPRMMKLEDVQGLVTDLDRTLADVPGRVGNDVIKALKGLRKPLILSTGRPKKFAIDFYKRYPIFDAVVSENGAVIYMSEDDRMITITNKFVATAMGRIKHEGIKARFGSVITSVNVRDSSRLEKALKPIRKHLKLVRNVDEIMVLPKNVDKATGSKIALDLLKLDPGKVIIIGDAENDVELFNLPGYRVAVANAHAKLKMVADHVTKKPASRGIIEIINQLKS
ncbi:glycosyltransferase [Candidatus Woesearchaeota archaeon]|nr:glycosyltransferase [Candidatus Woesearchaeota archaeon]